MKFLKIIFSAILLSTLLWSCKEEPNHYAQIANLTNDNIYIYLDTVPYKIKSMERTDFISIKEGFHEITGYCTTSFTIEGEGTHYWTVEIKENSAELILQQTE